MSSQEIEFATEEYSEIKAKKAPEGTIKRDFSQEKSKLRRRIEAAKKIIKDLEKEIKVMEDEITEMEIMESEILKI